MTDELNDSYDVVVIGGGAAGLNGALMLARARRSVVVIDAGAPRNAPAEGVHGLLGREGIPPAELLERGRAEVRSYGGHVVAGDVTTAVRDAEGLTVGLVDGRFVRARRMLVTTGLVDELPSVPGLRERWGRDVLHCPYCHGWEVRGQAIGVLASGPMSVHQALLLRQWSDDVTFFSHTMPPPTDEQTEQLAARGIAVVDGEVAALAIVDDRLMGVRLSDGTVIERGAVAVSPRMVARADFLTELGLKPVEHPSGVGEHIPCDATGRTDVPGVWVAGNVTDLAAQVGAAMAGGAAAAAQINADLVAEETGLAVAAHRARFDKELWEGHYRGHAGAGHGSSPNPSLVTEAGDLAPGRAMDAGCGHGADALWLASRGWRVTAIDVSSTVLSDARDRAASYGDEVASRIDWVEADLASWSPPEQRFDLVTSHYVHVPADDREAFVRRLAAAVAPGGSLLVVGHDASGLHEGTHGSAPEAYITADEVAALLDPAAWNVGIAETRIRTVTGAGSHEMTLRDAVLRARRRP